MRRIADEDGASVVHEAFGMIIYREPVPGGSMRWRFEVAGQAVSAICEAPGVYEIISALLQSVGSDDEYHLYRKVR